jgi:hypothetical protein
MAWLHGCTLESTARCLVGRKPEHRKFLLEARARQLPATDVLDWETAAEILAHWRRLEEERLRRTKERLAELERLQDELRMLEALTAVFLQAALAARATNA